MARVQKITNISPIKLRYWDEIGLVKPSASPERKRWQNRRYSFQDIICLLVVKALRKKGISIQKIRQGVERLREIGINQPLAELRVACLPHSVIFKKNGKFIEPISGQLVIAEALEGIKPRLERREIKSFASAERAIKKSMGLSLQKVAKI